MSALDGGRCPACDRVIAPDAAFCGGCGGAVTRLCPACGRANPRDHRFCDRCGVGLGDAVASAPRSSDPISGERRHLTVMFADL
ncbi:MAG TPA: zinc ribbon domain-containing protein, partial [Acidimicrobiales bacterium]